MRSVCLRVREKLWNSIVTTEVFSRGDPGIHARQRVLCRGKQVVGQKGWQNESTGTPIEGRTFWWPKIISSRAAAETQTTVKIQRTATDWEIMASWRKELSQELLEIFGVLDRVKRVLPEGVVGSWWINEGRRTLFVLRKVTWKKKRKKKEQLTCNLKKRSCEM